MALTLDATLAAAQNNASRKPLVEIISNPSTVDIPFTGNIYFPSTTTDSKPATTTLSNGSVVTVYFANNTIKYTYTNAAGTEFFSTIITPVNQTLALGISICELTNGNVGLVYFTNDGGYYSLKYRIVTPTGEAVSDGEITSISNSLFVSAPWIITYGVNSYKGVFVQYTGSAYAVVTFDSTDFTTWLGFGAITLTGLNNMQKVNNPSYYKDLAGTLWLWFDYVEQTSDTGSDLVNIYYMKSTDGGSTWSSPVKFTAFDSYSAVGRHPVMLEKSISDNFLLYTDDRTLLKFDTADYGNSNPGMPFAIRYDAVHNRLIVAQRNWAVTAINLNDWTLYKQWDQNSVPNFANLASRGVSGIRSIGTNLIPMPATGVYFVDVLNIQDDNFIHYNFKTWSDANGSRTKNVTFSDGWVSNDGWDNLYGVHMDETNNRLYLFFQANWGPLIAYIDTTQAGPDYTATVLVHGPDNQMVPFEAPYEFSIDTDNDLLMVYHSYTLYVYILSTGDLWKTYSHATNSAFPKFGVKRVIHLNGKIYGSFPYSTDTGEEDKRGLLVIDLASDATNFIRPSYATLNDYDFRDFHLGQANELLILLGDGVTRYDTLQNIWTLYDGNNVAGLTPPETFGYRTIEYDATNDYIYLGGESGFGTDWSEIRMFPGVGTIKRTAYYEATFSGGDWVWVFKDYLVKRNNNYDAVATLDPNNSGSMFVFWQTDTGKVMWAKDGTSLNISDYLVTDQEISITRSIDGNCNELNFVCSNGHLFDPHNANSVMRIMLKKGRKITVRWGENISGQAYWQNAGSFIVTQTNVTYRRTDYPIIKVVAEDMRTMWNESRIIATDDYTDYPESILTDLFKEHASKLDGDIDLPTFDNRETLVTQWLDTDFVDIVQQILDRFCYFLKITVDDKISAGKISNVASVDHVYSDNTKIYQFTPDDKYSDFTNRVIVVGKELSYTEVIMAEERITQMNGTVGWWGFKKDFRIPYSQDESRTCINPRLVVLESATSIAFALTLPDPFSGFRVSDIRQYISYIDPNDKYCIVTIECPDLTSIFVQSAIGLVISYVIPDWVIAYGGGETIRWGSYLTAMFSMGLFTIMAAVGNYQYEVYATPKGQVNRVVQGEADDEDLQNEIGAIVTKKIDDPLCYSVADCVFVAENELMITQMQRNRAKFKKVAHLQDEEGDTIQVKHPYTNVDLKFFVTKLTRRYKCSSDGTSNDGYFDDDIEGWVVSE